MKRSVPRLRRSIVLLAGLALAATACGSTVPRAQLEAALANGNSNGGIGGRKIVPVWAVFDTTSSQTIDQQAQAACATWTQDNKVFAIFGGAQGGIVQECTEKEHAINLDVAGASVPDDFRRYPHYLE